MIDPQWVSGVVGIISGVVSMVLKDKLRRDTTKRPLFENGQRDTIVEMIRTLREDLSTTRDKARESFRTMNDQLADLKLDSQEVKRVNRKIIERVEALEGK